LSFALSQLHQMPTPPFPVYRALSHYF